MSVDPRRYLHPEDEKALTALKAVPGFALLARAFIRVFAENPSKLIAMSNMIRVSPTQYPELYELLPPVCETLGIGEPELYVELDRQPNAYTIGDREALVVVTSGLLETLSLEEVSVVLAHECGHIACHHVLYRTIGMYLFHQMNFFFTIPYPVTAGIYLAMKRWMRCSELSADRAAAVCAGNSDQVIRLMMRLSGGCRNLNENFSTEEYLRQAEEYQREANRSWWSKITNIFVLAEQDHPFTATRALEIDKWCETDQFQLALEAA